MGESGAGQPGDAISRVAARRGCESNDFRGDREAVNAFRNSGGAGMKTILVVDDEPAARYGLRRALESKYRIAEADTAAAARESLRRESPDLLLLDIVMPSQDGLSFLRWMREEGHGQPVLIVSALDTAKTAVEALRLGASDYLVKGVELASSGTLVLDEIGDMNPVAQAKVLRALENRTIERLGGTQPIPVDVRVISATHRDLPDDIRAGKFREDLFYRVRVVTVELPALREHKEDIPLLAEAFLQLHAARMGRTAKLAREALAALERYDWPGNVRELKNALERSLVVGQGTEITLGDLPQEVLRGDAAPIRDARRLDTAGLGETDFREAKRKFEIAYIRGKLEQNRWNVSRTAASIGLHRQSLQEKLRELGIRRPGREPVAAE